jgi:cyclopropane-fatty-acyl-phospholipid synthase
MDIFNPNLKNYVQNTLAKADVQINGERPWDIQVNNEKFYPRVVIHGSLGLGEAYIDGWWNCPKLDEFFTKIFQAKIPDYNGSKNPRFFWEIAQARLGNMQSLSRAFQVGEHHYDLGNDLYQLILDHRLTYSCAYWKNAKTLDEAQEAKLDLICQKLQLQKGMTLLDIGCGWGSLMKYAAQKYEVSCVGLTVSKEQVALGEQLCEGLPVKFLLQDYRTFKGQFDRVASVGMFEHVGYKNYRPFMEMVNRCLEDNGLFLLHTMGNNTSCYGDLWTNKYIFPNGTLPSIAQIATATEGLFVMEDWHNFGQDYDITLLAVFENFDKNWDKIKIKYGERFYKIWKYFLLSFAGGFRARYLQLWQILSSKNGIINGYQSVR